MEIENRRCPVLTYSREESNDAWILPDSLFHSIQLPLQAELLSSGAKLIVEKVYVIGTDFLVFSRITQYQPTTRGYCIPRTTLILPHFTEFDPKKCRSINFVVCKNEDHTLIPTGEPFITRQVKDINEFWKFLYGIAQNPDYLDELEETSSESEAAPVQESPGEPKTWRRFMPGVRIPYIQRRP